MKNTLLIQPKSPQTRTQLHIGKGLLTSEQIIAFFRESKKKRVIVADAAVKELYATPLAKTLSAELIEIPSGEKTKSREMADCLIDKLMAMGAGRDTDLIAIGGGVTSDLAGFVASIYLRGISLILIPTTLLSAVDASIGGKTAVNTPLGKNLIGTIHHPDAIFIDVDTFATLSKKELFNGLAEIIKMGLIHDVSLLDSAKHNPTDPSCILQAIQAKITVVEQDPTELAIRRILNFGHTIGHALESISLYGMSHGEAVALGCIAESHLSMCLGYLSKEDFRKIQEIYYDFPLALPSNYEKSKLIQAMAHDKKRKQGEVRFVLLETLGKAATFNKAYCRSVSSEDLIPTLDWMEEVYSCRSHP